VDSSRKKCVVQSLNWIDKYLSAKDIVSKENLMTEVLKNCGRKLYYIFKSKHSAELSYWKKVYHKEGKQFDKSFYQKLMLGIAAEKDDSFLKGKMVADFGCGPRGSLEWISSAQRLIGIDVLAAGYQKAFPEQYRNCRMDYLECSEDRIPLPDASIDILFTINALDHVKHLDTMCKELVRILKPQGMILGSFNLNEPPHKAEPQMLTESLLQDTLFKDMEILSWRVTAAPRQGYRYQGLLDGELTELDGAPGILWAKARKN
jgi:ubiquinone/menaquinone biosynthesis C-methylase UbiE